MITNVTIISTNINKNIMNNYQDYKIIDKSFTYEELLQYRKVLFFNVLSKLNDQDMKKLFDFLNINNIAFINITNNIERVLFTNYLIIYDENKIIAEGNTIDLLKNEKLLKRLGFKLPFIIELSILLKDYNLINSIYLSKESLVGDIWK